MSENLRRMGVFATVVEAGNFSEAARRLGITRSAVSRQVALLERSLDVRLLNRTTRQINLTEAGESYYQGCARVLEAAHAADRSVQNLARNPTGTLRITAPVIGHEVIISVIETYLRRYPQMSVNIMFEDQYVNLIEEGYDLAIRIGVPADSSLVARRLAPVHKVVVGSRSYFEKHGRPKEPKDLINHQWIIYSLLASPNRLTFYKEDQRRTVTISSRLRINGGPALREAILAGLGLSMMPAFYVARDLEAGCLEVVLKDYRVAPSHLYAVFPHREHLPTKVRVFIELLVKTIAPRS